MNEDDSVELPNMEELFELTRREELGRKFERLRRDMRNLELEFYLRATWFGRNTAVHSKPADMYLRQLRGHWDALFAGPVKRYTALGHIYYPSDDYAHIYSDFIRGTEYLFVILVLVGSMRQVTPALAIVTG